MLKPVWYKPVRNKGRVLVVGTTSDYIEWIRTTSPGMALFLTLQIVRDLAYEPRPGEDEEILCDVFNLKVVRDELKRHLCKWDLSLEGVVAYDCESMELAALLAADYSLPYPSLDCITLSRDKNATKNIWRKGSIRCPEARLVQKREGVDSFMEEFGGPCVIKPLTGSGSELVLFCKGRKDSERVVRIIRDGLKKRRSLPLYSDHHEWFMVEEYICGDEYSCDFTFRENEIEILRLTKKIKEENQLFGTITGYVLTDLPEDSGGIKVLEDLLKRGADALGIDNAICMVDFIVSGREFVLLEMTPRPGGDCIPFLMKEAGMIDIITYALEFSRKGQTTVPVRSDGEMVGLRLHAGIAGKIRKIESNGLSSDSRVVNIKIIRKTGHSVRLPPEDYDSWYLGHIVFRAIPGMDLIEQCRDIRGKILVDIC